MLQSYHRVIVGCITIIRILLERVVRKLQGYDLLIRIASINPKTLQVNPHRKLILSRISLTSIVTISQHHFSDNPCVTEFIVEGICGIAFEWAVGTLDGIDGVNRIHPIIPANPHSKKVEWLIWIPPISNYRFGLGTKRIPSIVRSILVQAEGGKVISRGVIIGYSAYAVWIIGCRIRSFCESHNPDTRKFLVREIFEESE